MCEQEMDIWLFDVEDVFHLSGIGFVNIGNLEKSGEVIKTSDTLKILCLNGEEIVTSVKGIPMIHRTPCSLRNRLTPLELPTSEKNGHINKGAHVFKRTTSQNTIN